MKTFRKTLQSGGFPLTAEFSAWKPVATDEMLRQAGLLAGSVDAIQLTADAAAHEGIAPLALASLLIRQGIDPLPRLNCRDRNRIAQQSDLLGLRALGISSLILDRGRPFPAGIQPGARPVFDHGCRELIAMAHAMNEEDWPEGDHEFMIGTRTTACAPEPGWNNESLPARATAGARFVQTQPCLDVEVLGRYMQGLVEAKLTWNYSVIITLAPFPCADAARWLLQDNPAALVPAVLMDRLESAADPEQEGIDICASLMREVSIIPGVSGINLLSLGNPGAVLAAIDASGLKCH